MSEQGKKGTGMVRRWLHADGRKCLIDPDGRWRHWDFGGVKVGPADATPPTLCERSHSIDDRGEFGMPGVGSAGGMFSDMFHKVESGVTGPGLDLSPGRVVITDEQHQMFIVKTDQIKTDLAYRIIQEHLPLVIGHFLSRNAEYGEESHILGLKGQYADINRKVIKLKRYLWDDVPVPEGAESISIIAGELIGHLLILIDGLEDGQ